MPPRPCSRGRAYRRRAGLALAGAVLVGSAVGATGAAAAASAAAAAASPGEGAGAWLAEQVATTQPATDPTATTQPATDPTAPAATTEPAVEPTTPAAGGTSAVTETERLDDPETRHTINVLTAVLLGLAVLVVGLTAWFWRTTRPLPAALEPLAAMSTRRFRRAPPEARAQEVHAVHELKAASDPPPRAADFLRQVRGEDG